MKEMKESEEISHDYPKNSKKILKNQANYQIFTSEEKSKSITITFLLGLNAISFDFDTNLPFYPSVFLSLSGQSVL